MLDVCTCLLSVYMVYTETEVCSTTTNNGVTYMLFDGQYFDIHFISCVTCKDTHSRWRFLQRFAIPQIANRFAT